MIDARTLLPFFALFLSTSFGCLQEIEGPEDGELGRDESLLMALPDDEPDDENGGGSSGGTYVSSYTCSPTTAPTHPPTWDSRWAQGLSLSTDNTILGADIGQYRIQWFGGSWSPWYTPGADDLDWKTNYDGSQRRVWSYFIDHNHQYLVDSGVHSPTWNSQWTQGLSGSTDNTILGKDIAKYRVQWFNGSWSAWYTPCVDDVDWKTNGDGTQRRVWSYFVDHNHQYYTYY